MDRILLVEDDDALRAMLATALSREGYEVIEAADGDEGLAAFDAHAPDATILDLFMPRREGLETLRLIQKRRPGAAVIAISGGGDYGPRPFLQVALRLGASATLAKPFEPAQLVQLLRGLDNQLEGRA